MLPEIEEVIVKEYYNFLGICKKYTKNNDWAQELLHFIIADLYERNGIKVKLQYDQIKWYIIQIIKIQWCSKDSSFYRNIKKFSMTDVDLTECMEIVLEEYNHEDDKLLQLLEEEYGDLDWYDKMQFQTYLLTGTLKQTAEKHDSTTSKVWHSLQATKKLIKNNIEQKLNA